MRHHVINIIAAAERTNREGYADLPPGSINDEIESELAMYGYAIGRSDRLWAGGFRIYGPESIAAGNYRFYVPRSVFTCEASKGAHVPDAPDFDFEAVLELRGELRSN
jgi:hypothetical protein